MSDIDHKTATSQPWHPMTNAVDKKHIGKALEECGELTAALSRCLIQGIYECEPVTGKKNIRWLEEEIADVFANLHLVSQRFNLDSEFIGERILVKMRKLREWHSMA